MRLRMDAMLIAVSPELIGRGIKIKTLNWYRFLDQIVRILIFFERVSLIGI